MTRGARCSPTRGASCRLLLELLRRQRRPLRRRCDRPQPHQRHAAASTDVTASTCARSAAVARWVIRAPAGRTFIRRLSRRGATAAATTISRNCDGPHRRRGHRASTRTGGRRRFAVTGGPSPGDAATVGADDAAAARCHFPGPRSCRPPAESPVVRRTCLGDGGRRH